MKRKLALLLAAVMSLSMLPMNVFAATENRLTETLTVMPEKTVVVERDIFSGAVSITPNTTDVKAIAGGVDFIVKLKDTLKPGDRFQLKLDNAVWFFRGSLSAASEGALAALGANNAGYLTNYTNLVNNQYSNNEKWNFSGDTSGLTYNFNTGSYYPNSTNSKNGTYVRYGNLATGTLVGIPYMLEVSSASDSEATITILSDGTHTTALNPYSADAEIRIPLVVRTLAEDDVKITIPSGGTSSVSTGTYLFAMTSKTLTNTYVNDPKTQRQNLELDRIVIKEQRLASIKSGEFSITAPRSFEFNDPSSSTVQVGVETGLSWQEHTAEGLTGGRTGFGVKGTDYTIAYKYHGTTDEDRAVIVVNIWVNQSSDVVGSVFIEGLELYGEDDNAAWGDVMLTIKENSSNKSGISTQTFKAGTNMDWTISLTTEGTIPELVNGRYEKTEMDRAEDDHHKTAKVVFAENTTSAWWSARQTVFTLPTGVKFRKVEIDEVEHFSTPTEDDFKATTYVNDNKKSTTGVTINGNTMTWSNIKLTTDSDNVVEKAKVKMDIWVSIESGYTGDVTLSVTGSAIPVQTTETSGIPTVVIAKQISPVTVTSKITDIRIGYQYQDTADIIITETKAGNLLKNRNVRVTISDSVDPDMSFWSDAKVAVTEGDLKIKDVDVDSGVITFDIDTESSKASTITITNVAVKIDRTVPVTNKKPYDVTAGGTAIAGNYQKASATSYFTTNDKKNLDTFTKEGITAEYVRVVSSAEDNPNVLTQEVRVTIGETFYTVNGVPYEMPVAPYISTASNSTMVPVRFVGNAFGISDDSIIWDDANHTATFILPSRIIQFQAGSDKMKLNGSDVVLRSPDGKAVSAEIVDERMFVPFRALGDAFGVPVSWDDATSTAIYNEGANTGGTTAE